MLLLILSLSVAAGVPVSAGGSSTTGGGATNTTAGSDATYTTAGSNATYTTAGSNATYATTGSNATDTTPGSNGIYTTPGTNATYTTGGREPGTGCSSTSWQVVQCQLSDVILHHPHASVTVTANACHAPIDISFAFKSSEGLSFNFTFVPANQNARLVIPGASLTPPVPQDAPVSLYVREPQQEYNSRRIGGAATITRLTVQASLVADLKDGMWEEELFLNHSFHVSGVPCIPPRPPHQGDNSEPSTITKILVSSCVLVVLAVAAAAGYLQYRIHTHRNPLHDHLHLVRHTDPPHTQTAESTLDEPRCEAGDGGTGSASHTINSDNTVNSNNNQVATTTENKEENDITRHKNINSDDVAVIVSESSTITANEEQKHKTTLMNKITKKKKSIELTLNKGFSFEKFSDDTKKIISEDDDDIAINDTINYEAETAQSSGYASNPSSLSSQDSNSSTKSTTVGLDDREINCSPAAHNSDNARKSKFSKSDQVKQNAHNSDSSVKSKVPKSDKVKQKSRGGKKKKSKIPENNDQAVPNDIKPFSYGSREWLQELEDDSAIETHDQNIANQHANQIKNNDLTKSAESHIKQNESDRNGDLITNGNEKKDLKEVNDYSTSGFSDNFTKSYSVNIDINTSNSNEEIVKNALQSGVFEYSEENRAGTAINNTASSVSDGNTCSTDSSLQNGARPKTSRSTTKEF